MEADLYLGASDADGVDEQPYLVLLPGEDVHNASMRGGALRVCAGGTR